MILDSPVVSAGNVVSRPASAGRQRVGGSAETGSVAGGCSAQSDAACVLPEPVGATTGACRPAATACQAPRCA